MLNLPNLGDRVRVWPFPGRRIQLDARPVTPDKGGRYMDEDGQEIVWSEFHLEQLRAGDLLLHSPIPQEAEPPPPAAAPAPVAKRAK